MQPYRKIIRIIIVQVILLAFFFWYFLHYSFLRPCMDKEVEGTIAAIAVIVMLADFWIVFPAIQEKLPPYMFMVIIFLEASFICAIEYFMTCRFVTGVFSDSIRDFGARTILFPIYGNIFLRDLSLLLFVWLSADNIKLSDMKAEDDKALFLSNNQLIAKNQDKICIVDMADVFFCRQERNYTTLYCIDGQRYKKRISLSDLEVLLHDNQFVRISRSDIVRISAIRKCQDCVLILRKEIVTDKRALSVTKTFQDTAIPKVLNFLQQECVFEAHSPEQSVQKYEDESIVHNHPKAAIIRCFISAHHDCKLDDIVSGTRIPKSTVTRYLKELQEDGLIEYTGSKKTGGYRVVNHENQQQEPSNVQ